MRGYYTQTKEIRPIFMVLYLLIQLRCCSKKNKPTWLSNVRHTNFGSENSSFHYQQKVHHQNVTHFTLNGNHERPTMKKHLKIPNVIIKRATFQFKTANLRI